MMILLTVSAVIISTVMLVRVILIVAGYYKDPVLRTFEWYGPEERLYTPVPHLIIWAGVLVAVGGSLLFNLFGSYFLFIWLLLMFILLTMAPDYQALIRRHARWLTMYPRWYSLLLERTTRDERRHLAFMWLRLPKGLRAFYNSNDYAFFQWADLVIMSNPRMEA